MRSKQIFIAIAIITLVSSVAACQPVSRAGFLAPTPTPTLWPPIPGPRLTPLPFEPADALEGRVTKIYEQVSGSVVNITNRSIAYD